MMTAGDFVGALAPARVLGEFDGIPVVLVTAELWTGCLFVGLCAVQNDLTRARDARFTTECAKRERRIRAARARGAPLPAEVPEQPGAVLGRLPLSVGDDLGTAYRAGAISAGGTGTEWRAEWRFDPGVPAQAAVLSVRVQTPGGPRACDIALTRVARASSLRSE